MIKLGTDLTYFLDSTQNPQLLQEEITLGSYNMPPPPPRLTLTKLSMFSMLSEHSLPKSGIKLFRGP